MNYNLMSYITIIVKADVVLRFSLLYTSTLDNLQTLQGQI